MSNPNDHRIASRQPAGSVYAAVATATGPVPATDLTKTPPPKAGRLTVARVDRSARSSLGDLLRGLPWGNG